MQKDDYKYKCADCDYSTKLRFDYNKHLKTDKHLINTNQLKTEIKINQCEYCEKIFSSQCNHSRHKKTCKIKKQQQDQLDEKDNKIKLLELQLAEQSKNQQVKIDLSNNVINNNTINNNKTIFNLKIFLNETCKEAITIENFMENYQFGYDDFLKVGSVGFSKAITNSLISNLNLLGIHKRPIHCIDFKRNLFCIKDKQNNWNKDTTNNTILKKTITKLEDKALQFIPVYKSKNQHHTQEQRLVFVEKLIGHKENDINKIITNLSQNLKIDK
jgi:hypothetical protein